MSFLYKNATALAICNYRVGHIEKSREIIKDIFSIHGIDLNSKCLGKPKDF